LRRPQCAARSTSEPWPSSLRPFEKFPTGGRELHMNRVPLIQHIPFFEVLSPHVEIAFLLPGGFPSQARCGRVERTGGKRFLRLPCPTGTLAEVSLYQPLPSRRPSLTGLRRRLARFLFLAIDSQLLFFGPCGALRARRWTGSVSKPWLILCRPRLPEGSLPSSITKRAPSSHGNFPSRLAVSRILQRLP